MSNTELFVYPDLINIFNNTFYASTNTKLVKGEDEPIYLPADQDCGFHRIVFAHGYFSSALHEVAHWCIAGKQRRLVQDYGYWYCPDGRNQQQQAEFEQVEIKPQAIEWAFCLAIGCKFNVSTDNLNGFEADAASFRVNVERQLRRYQKDGFPTRAQQFIDALRAFYAGKVIPNEERHCETI